MGTAAVSTCVNATYRSYRYVRGGLGVTAWWVAAALLLVLVADTSVRAQIPEEVVDRAVKGDVKPSVMLTACKKHTYRHRLRLEEVKIQTQGDTLTYSGKIVNVIRNDRNNLMWFTITMQGKSDPVIEITKTEEREIWPKVKKELKQIFVDVIIPATKEIIEASFASSSAEQEKALESAESRFESMNQKDWKTPSLALITMIAARLHTMHN